MTPRAGNSFSLGDVRRARLLKGLEEAGRPLDGMARAGQVPDDHVDPRSLGPVARVGLKEAFKIVMHEQKSLAADLGVSY